jgi:hypothetical protein
VPRSNRCAERCRPARSRPVGTRAADDRGSASLEFLTAGMLLLVPLVFLILPVTVLFAVWPGLMVLQLGL